jgi:ABC-type multidrug transport system fused ATPase/permease subunit
LVLIPVVAFIVILEVFAKTDEKNSSVAKLMNGLLGLLIIIGIVILIFAISNVVSDYKNFVSLDTLRKFLLPPVLTILFLPFIYFMVLFSTYEQLFVQLNLGYEKSKKLKRYAKRKIIQHCLLSLKKVKKALNTNTYNLKVIRYEEDVDKLIEDLK